jgi:hypothetical protein
MLPIFRVFLVFVKFSLKNKEDSKAKRHPNEQSAKAKDFL